MIDLSHQGLIRGLPRGQNGSTTDYSLNHSDDIIDLRSSQSLINETKPDLCPAVLASRWTDVTLEMLSLSIQIYIEVSNVN